MISGYSERPGVSEVPKATLQALQQDYPELEVEDVTEKLAGHQSKGYNINFLSLDTVNDCKIRTFRTSSCTILILSQTSSYDTATHVAVLDAIRSSMKLV